MNRTVKESETAKIFRIRRRAILKGAIESGCLKMHVRHRCTTFSIQGIYVGIALGKKEIEDSLSMIANILESFDLRKKEWAREASVEPVGCCDSWEAKEDKKETDK